MHLDRSDHFEEHRPELSEIRTGCEAAWHDEDKIAVLPKECGTHGHEEGVDIRLTMHYSRGGSGLGDQFF